MVNGLAVFFDIGDTLAAPRTDGDRLVGLDVYPFVPDVLSRLRFREVEPFPVQLGLMSNTGGESAATLRRVLIDSGLAALVDPGLCLFSSLEGIDKSRAEFFERGRVRADLAPERCIFVGESAAERMVAASVGFRVSPNPLHAVHLVESAP